MAAPSEAAVRYEDADAASSFAGDVIAGLTAQPKRLPPKYFYDETGAQLFEQITALPEYYLTRCELQILRERARDMAHFFPMPSALIEFGSGSSKKMRILLAAASTIAAYVPVDISSQMLVQEAQELRRDHPRLAVLPVEADFTKPFALPAAAAGMAHTRIDHRQFRAARSQRVPAPRRANAGTSRYPDHRGRSGEGGEYPSRRIQ
jgi:uncharacterized SAM-dependent methyltransferase